MLPVMHITQYYQCITYVAAVQRKYESVRQLWKMEDRDDFEELHQQLSVTK